MVGKGPRHEVPHMVARKWETLFIIYTHNGAASASRATKAGREGGYGVPRALAEELGRIQLLLKHHPFYRCSING